MTHNELLKRLSHDVERFIESTNGRFILLNEFTLNEKHSPANWSLLECFEHLNRYNRYYNPLLLRAIENSPSVSSDTEVKSTWLGRKFIRMMDPGNAKKQKTLRRMDPSNSILTVAVIKEFLLRQNELARIIELANGKNLNRAAIAVEFFKLLKLSPAEALQFVIVHQQRHFLQLERILKMNQDVLMKV